MSDSEVDSDKSALQISDLHHVAVACRDAEISTRFYCDLLGFRLLPRPPFDFPGAWLFAGNMQIHLIQSGGNNLDFQRGKIDSRTFHLAFRVPCLRQAMELLRAQNVEFIHRVNAGGIEQIFLQDPDGLNIELTVASDPQYGYLPS